MKRKQKQKTITITVKGNSFADQYAKGGQKEYWSKWRVVFKQDKFGNITQKIDLINYNLDEPKNVEKEYQKLAEYQKIQSFGL